MGDRVSVNVCGKLPWKSVVMKLHGFAALLPGRSIPAYVACKILIGILVLQQGVGV